MAGAAPPGKGGPGDTQAVVLNRVEYAQAGIGAIARDQYHLNPAVTFQQTVDAQQLLHQRKGFTRLQRLVFVRYLIQPVGFQPLALEDSVAIIQIKQGSGRNGDNQFVAELAGHADFLLIGQISVLNERQLIQHCLDFRQAATRLTALTQQLAIQAVELHGALVQPVVVHAWLVVGHGASAHQQLVCQTIWHADAFGPGSADNLFHHFRKKQIEYTYRKLK